MSDWVARIRDAQEDVRRAEWVLRGTVAQARKEMTLRALQEQTGIAETTIIKYQREVDACEREFGTGPSTEHGQAR